MAQFTNQAQLSYNNAIKNSNIAVGEIQEVLSATKTAISTGYNVDEDVAYAISIVNSGNTAITGVSVTDNLGSYTFNMQTYVPLTYVDGTIKYYVNGILQAAPAVVAGNSLVISGLTIPANSTVMLLYEAEANQFAPLAGGSTITNEATIIGGGVTNITTSATVPITIGPDLTITKSISPVPVTENGTLTYTFVIQNTGNEAAVTTDNAIITDVFNPILSNVSATFNGAPWVEGTDYTYDEVTGTFVSEGGRITVPAATYTQDAVTGAWTVTPGVSTLVITGTV